MESTDELIHGLYAAAMDGEWRDYRTLALTRLCERAGASSGAWWTRGARAEGGEFNQYPQAHTTTAALAKLPLSGEALVELPGEGGRVQIAFRFAAPRTAIIETVLLGFPAGAKLPGHESLRRALSHMVEAGLLSIVQFIRRDDWLASMGRTNRGAAAMVDVDGSVFAASPRFLEMMEGDGMPAKLPFELPSSALGTEGGEFVQGALHVRVKRCGALLLLYARRPLPLDALSPREQEIARALGNGKTLKTIARQYGIAVSTVANHTTRIYRKLAIYRREDLIDLVRIKPETAARSKNGNGGS